MEVSNDLREIEGVNPPFIMLDGFGLVHDLGTICIECQPFIRALNANGLQVSNRPVAN